MTINDISRSKLVRYFCDTSDTSNTNDTSYPSYTNDAADSSNASKTHICFELFSLSLLLFRTEKEKEMQQTISFLRCKFQIALG